jgi:hypothetical protein
VGRGAGSGVREDDGVSGEGRWVEEGECGGCVSDKYQVVWFDDGLGRVGW